MTDNVSARPPNPTSAHRLPGLATTIFSGPDCAKFLQGYLTCDTQRLITDRAKSASASALPAALCNIKGRVVANGWAFALPAKATGGADTESIALVTHRSVAASLRETLQPYMVFSKTTAEPSAASLFGSVDTASQAGAIELDERRQLYWREGETDLAATAHTPPNLFMDSLLADRMVLVDAISAGTYLPQMLGLSDWGAVDFAKGCYLGQEVVARAEHRGQVKRQLFALTAVSDAIDGGSLPADCAVLDLEGKALGALVQVSDANVNAGQVLALAVLNIRSLAQSSVVTLQDRKEPVAILPFPGT